MGVEIRVDGPLVAAPQRSRVPPHSPEVGGGPDGPDVPGLKRLIEARRAERVLEAGDLAHVPPVQRLIELSRSVEHGLHGGHLAHVPRIEWLIESSAALVAESVTFEQALHVGCLADIPTVQRLVESSRLEEHLVKGGNLAYVPGVEILIERACAVRVAYEIFHVSDAAHPPI